VDVTAALQDYQSGSIGGLVLEGSSTAASSIQNFDSYANLAGNGANSPGLLVDFTAVPEPASITLAAGMLLLGWAAARRRLIRAWMIPLAWTLCHPAVQAESTWIVGRADPAALEAATGQPGQALRALWKEAQACELEPALCLRPSKEIAIQQPRTFPAASGLALIGLECVFGNAPGRIPAQAVIDEAWLWLHVSSGAGAITVEVRGLPSADADWQPDEACFAEKAAGVPWSGGALPDSFTASYGKAGISTQAGWLRLPVDLAGWVADLQQGRASALGLDPGGTVTGELRNIYFDADTSEQDRPGLFVKWHLPTGVPQLARCPAKICGHGQLAPLALTAADASEVTVDGERAIRTGQGAWQILLAPGLHQVLAANALGQAAQYVQVERQELRLQTRTANDGSRKLAWAALPGYRYRVEGGGIGRWQSVPGAMETSADGSAHYFPILDTSGSQFFRIVAEPE
jgi:hypothetical protein